MRKKITVSWGGIYIETIDMAKARFGKGVVIEESVEFNKWMLTSIVDNQYVCQSVDKEAWHFKETFLSRCKEYGLNEKGKRK